METDAVDQTLQDIASEVRAIAALGPKHLIEVAGELRRVGGIHVPSVATRDCFVILGE